MSPFAKGVPSIFAVGSPFQALCAVEAIKDLEIEDYLFYVFLSRNSRDNQIISVCNYFNIQYVVVDKYAEVYPIRKRLQIFWSRKSKYIRAFVGHYYSAHHYYWVLQCISDKSVVISLDDGNETISLLRNSYKRKQKHFFSGLNNFFLRIVTLKRSIEIRRHLYTIYSDIPNARYVCYSNSFSHIFPQGEKNQRKDVFFVGTNPPSYRNQMDMSEDQYFSLLEMSFQKIILKSPTEKKYYIPHGMDNEDYVIRLCEQYNMKYCRPNSTIELFLCKLDYAPRLVIGFTSSALYNIKKMSPNTEVINVLVVKNGRAKEPYCTFTDYYSKNGIVTIEENI